MKSKVEAAYLLKRNGSWGARRAAIRMHGQRLGLMAEDNKSRAQEYSGARHCISTYCSVHA